MPSRVIKSFLPEDNWETSFNKIGKSYEERQLVVDNEMSYFGDFLGKGAKSASVGKYVVNKYTIDKLSEDIEMLMR